MDKKEKNAPHGSEVNIVLQRKDTVLGASNVIPLNKGRSPSPRKALPKTISEIVAGGFPRCACGQGLGPCRECPKWWRAWHFLRIGRYDLALNCIREAQR